MYWRWHLPEKEHVSLFFLDLITLELVYIAWPNTTFNWAANSSFVSTIKVNLSIARNHRPSNGEITPPVACFFAPASENHHTLSTWGLLIIHWLPDFTEPISMSVTVCFLCISNWWGPKIHLGFLSKQIQTMRHLGGFWGLPMDHLTRVLNIHLRVLPTLAHYLVDHITSHLKTLPTPNSTRW